jgi:hypothetical protein
MAGSSPAMTTELKYITDIMLGLGPSIHEFIFASEENVRGCHGRAVA